MKDNDSLSLFFLSGLTETKNYRFPLFFLTLLCYCLILLVNASVIVTIILDKNLHEPMYVFLCALCVNALYGTTGFYPKFLWDLLSPVHVISYSGCLVQTLVFSSFLCIERSILAVMAYDRYVAICQPLEYHSIMSKQRLMKLVCYSWLTPFFIVATKIFLTSRVKLCSPYIDRFYCANWMIVRLACFPADIAVNNVVLYAIVIIYVLHGVFIFVSYIVIIKLCAKSIENRAKFMQTCVPHLISLFNFVVVRLYIIINARFGSKELPQSLENFLLIEFLIIPPIMNPLIYGFKLPKIRNRILGFVTVIYTVVFARQTNVNMVFPE